MMLDLFGFLCFVGCLLDGKMITALVLGFYLWG